MYCMYVGIILWTCSLQDTRALGDRTQAGGKGRADRSRLNRQTYRFKVSTGEEREAADREISVATEPLSK